MRYIFVLLFFASMGFAVDLDTRHFYMTNDVSSARSAVSPFRWYQGESVKLDLYVKRGSSAVDLSASGLFPRWEAYVDGNLTNAYIMTTGTVENATNGHVGFALSPATANLPTNTYTSYIKLYQPILGTNTYVGMALKTETQVYWSPSATEYTYQGPWTNSSDGYLTSAEAQATYVDTIINGGTSGTTGSVSRSGAEVTLTFPSPSSASTNLSDYNNDVPFLITETDPLWASVSNQIQTDVQSNNAKQSYPTADSNKLAGIESGATSNSTDAYLLARANHTGTQLASTISDFQTQVSNNTLVASALQNGDSNSNLVNGAGYLTGPTTDRISNAYVTFDNDWEPVSSNAFSVGSTSNWLTSIYCNTGNFNSVTSGSFTGDGSGLTNLSPPANDTTTTNIAQNITLGGNNISDFNIISNSIMDFGSISSGAFAFIKSRTNNIGLTAVNSGGVSAPFLTIYDSEASSHAGEIIAASGTNASSIIRFAIYTSTKMDINHDGSVNHYGNSVTNIDSLTASTGTFDRVYLGSTNVYVEAQGTTNILFVAGTNSANIGW